MVSTCCVVTPHTAETRETKRDGGGDRDEEERSEDVIRLSTKAGKERGEGQEECRSEGRGRTAKSNDPRRCRRQPRSHSTGPQSRHKSNV